jgi:hypothetical protein
MAFFIGPPPPGHACACVGCSAAGPRRLAADKVWRGPLCLNLAARPSLGPPPGAPSPATLTTARARSSSRIRHRLATLAREGSSRIPCVCGEAHAGDVADGRVHTSGACWRQNDPDDVTWA